MKKLNSNQIINSPSVFVSKPIRVDFIAYHDLQAVAGMSVFEEMSQHFDCRWQIGPSQKPTGAEAAILLDHTQHHPEIRKSPDGYQYLFYMSHDLGDLDVYEVEKQRLRHFNIIFVPSSLHLKNAQKSLSPSYAQPSLGTKRVILEVGWPKYDCMEIPEKYDSLRDQLENFSYPHTVIYAPTWAYTWEWKEILPRLCKLQCNVIVKNHIYVNPGQAYPQGHEKTYEECLRSVKEMEEYLLSHSNPNFVVAPRELNICSLFPFADLLISDQSSVNLEFLPFGISIETGRFNPNPNQLQPQSSLVSDVIFIPLENLNPVLESSESFREFLAQHSGTKSHNFVRRSQTPAGQLTAQLIDKYVSFWQVFTNPIKSASAFSEMMERWREGLLTES